MTEPVVTAVVEPEYSIDISNLPKQKHNWVPRGLKVSCEGAGHPHHSHFLRKPMQKI